MRTPAVLTLLLVGNRSLLTNQDSKVAGDRDEEVMEYMGMKNGNGVTGVFAITVCLWMAVVSALAQQVQTVPAMPKPVHSEQYLRDMIHDAIATKANSLRIPPGIYRIGPDASGKAHLLFQDLHDLVIDATGVELIMTNGLKTALVAVYNCRNITLKGLTVDCDPVTFLQGKVAAMAPDRTWYDLQVDPGYTLDPVAGNIRMRPMNIIDKKPPELSWKHGVPDLYPSKMEWVAGQGGVLRVYMLPHCRGKSPVEVDDWAVFPAFGAPGFTCRGSVNVTFDHCTIYQSGSMAFHEHGGDGNTHMMNCRVLRRPKSGRLLSTNADGFHSKNMRKGPTIENCVFEGMHDDGFNVHGMFGAVAGTVTDSTKVRIVPFFEDSGKPGDIIEFFAGKTGESLGCRTLRKALLVNNPNLERAKTYHNGNGAGLLFEYELDSPVTLQDADASMNLNLCGRGFAIRHCEFRAFRYRGLLLRSMDGVVENNRIFAVGHDGMALESDLFSEGPYARNIRISNNVVEKTGMIPFMESGRGISVWSNARALKTDTHSLRLNRDIVIENNSISDVTRDGIYLRNTDGIILRNNTISGVGSRKVHCTTPPQPVSVSDVDHLQTR